MGRPAPPRHLGVHPALWRLDPYSMMTAIERIGKETGRSMTPLAMHQQRTEETIAYQKKKEPGKKDLDEFDLAKLKE